MPNSNRYRSANVIGLALFSLLSLGLGLLALPMMGAQASSSRSASCSTSDLVDAVQSAVNGGGARTISLDAFCTYTLTQANNGGSLEANGLPLITNTVNLTINGNGATILRDPNAPRFRLFRVAAGSTLTLDHVRLIGGYTSDGAAGGTSGGFGGAIYNQGTLNIRYSLLGENATGNGGPGDGLHRGGDGGWGGALYSDNGTVAIAYSTFYSNTTGQGGPNDVGFAGRGGAGGGIYSTGLLTITNSTINGNTTGDRGIGAIDGQGGDGAGVFFNGYAGGGMSVVNSTVGGNSTGGSGQSWGGRGGGIFVGDGPLTITYSTIVSNTAVAGSGGGIYTYGSAVLQNSILSNIAGGNCFADVPFGSITDGGGNLVWGDISCPGLNQDPRLDPAGFRNNGGPTETIGILPDSPALDAAVDSICPSQDQRGLPRPFGTHCDTGAFEFGSTLRQFLPLVRK